MYKLVVFVCAQLFVAVQQLNQISAASVHLCIEITVTPDSLLSLSLTVYGSFILFHTNGSFQTNSAQAIGSELEMRSEAVV